MCCKKRKEHTYRGHHLPWRKKKGEKQKETKKEVPSIELANFDWIVMVLPPTLFRHKLAKSTHATFLYPTARLPPLFDAVASGARRTSKARSCSPTTTWILGAYPFSGRCTTKSSNQLQKRVLPALFHLPCPSQSHERSARGRTRLTTVTSISCRSL